MDQNGVEYKFDSMLQAERKLFLKVTSVVKYFKSKRKKPKQSYNDITKTYTFRLPTNA